jgi:hypothetical protein
MVIHLNISPYLDEYPTTFPFVVQSNMTALRNVQIKLRQFCKGAISTADGHLSFIATLPCMTRFHRLHYNSPLVILATFAGSRTLNWVCCSS